MYAHNEQDTGMRTRAWIRQIRNAEAQQIRQAVFRLETELLNAVSSKSKGRMQSVGHDLRIQKARLTRLEECLAGLEPTAHLRTGTEVNRNVDW